MHDETTRQELLQGSGRSNSLPVNEIKKFREIFLPFLIICIACAPVAYLLSFLLTEYILPRDVCHKRVVGYYTVWEKKTLTVNQLENLTHLIFMFAYITSDGSVKVKEGAYTTRAYDMKEVISMARKNGSLKLMMAVGDHDATVYPSMLSDPVRKNTITQLFEEYDIDGIEIFWMYVSEKDKVNHMKLIREVRKHLTSLKTSKGKKEDYVFSTISSRYTGNREHIYNNEVLKYVDFLTVQSHDWSYLNKYVGPVAPLYGGPKDSIDDAMKYLVCQTEQPSKLNLGIPMFGIQWINTSMPIDDSRNQLSIPKKAGEKQYSYFFWREEEAKTFIPSEVSWHAKSQTPYMFRNNIFLSFENERSVQAKANYTRMKNIGGIAIYAIDQDDKYVLVNAISSVNLCSGEDENKIQYDCK
ncbi:Protein CBG04890 [Caenorhabditis briggsae]|uniref:Protein CBG04890 n=1 Tax=Caenorhabditis briggsae TaxID=6238 RepID=A8WYQ7_CAEBR|nr:Protein CBG04890 [Caenorhabditis briggsae]CAP25515.2 Protein CBG04890 [Caenorhabditis briggsae]